MEERYIKVTADGITSYQKALVVWQFEIGQAFLPTFKRLVAQIENIERVMRSREALKRVVILAGVWLVMLVLIARGN